MNDMVLFSRGCFLKNIFKFLFLFDISKLLKWLNFIEMLITASIMSKNHNDDQQSTNFMNSHIS